MLPEQDIDSITYASRACGEGPIQLARRIESAVEAAERERWCSASIQQIPRDEVADEALKDLRVRWVIRQQVRTVEKRWLVDLFETEHERIARQDYGRLVRDNPDAYFELLAVLHSEVCKEFTAPKG